MDSEDEEFNPSSARAQPAPSRPARQPKKTRGGTKLKVNLGTRGGNSGYGKGDGWDRELDSDPDEPLAIEEQFILRVPPSLVPKMKTMVESRKVGNDVWFKFKDARRGTFHFGEKLFSTKLVDLPTLVESQKSTGVGGHYVKTGDISQMLVVENEIKDDGKEKEKEKVFNINDFIWQHGISPPLKHVRTRRFRRRVNRRTIEVVESAVEKLLEDDSRADDVQYG